MEEEEWEEEQWEEEQWEEEQWELEEEEREGGLGMQENLAPSLSLLPNPYLLLESKYNKKIKNSAN